MRTVTVVTALLLAACSKGHPTSGPVTADKPDATTSGPRSHYDAAAPRPIAFKWSGKFSTSGLPMSPRSFASARKMARNIIYKGHRVTFYCGCGYDAEKKVDASKCGYRPRSDNVRARRIEWAHVVPASAFGQHRACWKPGACPKTEGRLCCRKIDKEFRRMEADLQNLVPAVGEISGDRSNFRFDSIPGEARVYGKCDFEVDRSNKVAEPPLARRGDIARAYLYMHYAYTKYEEVGLPLTKAQIQRFLRWHRDDPPDQWEKERNKRIAVIQSGDNPLVVPTLALSCSSCTEAKFIRMVSQLKQPGNVTDLTLYSSRITNSGLAHLAKLKNLRGLTLSVWGTKVNDSGLAPLAKLKNLRSLELTGTKVGNAGLAHLAKLTDLTLLILREAKVDSTGLAHLSNLTNLRDLSLDFTRIGNAGLAHLSNLTNLRDLSLNYTKVGNAGLSYLAKLINLEELFLTDTRVGNAGLVHLAKLTKLKWLSLGFTNVGDSGLVHLAKLTSLRKLYLTKTKVGDAGMAHLANLRNLKDLRLGHTRVGDAGLEHLAKIKSLRNLDLFSTEASDAAVARFRKSNPECSVAYCHRRKCPRDGPDHRGYKFLMRKKRKR